MVEGLVPAGAIVVDVLSKDNYEHWSALVKNYLLAQDLWDVVEATAEPPVPEEADQFIGRKKTAAALHAIQISCGPDAFSVIKEISSSKLLGIFWPKRSSHTMEICSVCKLIKQPRYTVKKEQR
ncbi:hypothetical protein Prudu_005353 [Prunus dulcis]|uniref:DUF4219 domain-containing protein n=1 Tax=Prunus dulcis TaxID=3755 RepID=A0A4Y1QXD8_PRUDU|nr:hypothetical protein Prudu_005353 [Prunus dulcis]